MRIVRLACTVFLAAMATAGCGGGPTEVIPGVFAIPGGALDGEEATAASWSEVVREDGILDLETRPSDPYSVRVGFVLKDDRIYIDPADGREWNANLKADPPIRVRIDDRVYAAIAVPVTDAAEREGFDADRNVYRLDLSR